MFFRKISKQLSVYWVNKKEDIFFPIAPIDFCERLAGNIQKKNTIALIIHRNKAKLCVMNIEWNKPPYIASHVSNNAILKLSHHIIPENSSIRIATRFN